MLFVSMPKFFTSSVAVDTATKCLATADSSLSAARAHARAERAFISVSCVVNVFDATMKSVVSGSRCFVVSTRCVPSTFYTK